MTVKELICILNEHDGDSLVVIDGYEGGVTKEFEIIKSKIKPNINKKWYYGESEIDTSSDVKVVYISRERLVEDREF
jgi:hypothetical protein